MAAEYPTAAKSFTAVNAGDTITDTMWEAAYDEITAIEQALLTTGFAHNLFPSTSGTRDLGTSSLKWRDLYLSDQIFERDRTVALGEWTTPSFSAGNFTGGASQTWTVAAGDVTTYAYTLVGKMMTVAFDIRTSTVGGTPDPELRIAIPASKTATKIMTNLCIISDNGGARTTGFCQVQAAETHITIWRDLTSSANWTAATDTTTVQGQITFEVD